MILPRTVNVAYWSSVVLNPRLWHVLIVESEQFAHVTLPCVQRAVVIAFGGLLLRLAILPGQTTLVGYFTPLQVIPARIGEHQIVGCYGVQYVCQ